MDIFGCIFLNSITLTLIFAGVAKMLSFTNTIDTIIKIGIFPKKISKAVGVFMPLFEITTAGFLIIKLN